MYQSFSFDNYRMFKGEYHLKLKPITIFTGANNSGKSSLIKLLYQTSQHFKGCSWIDSDGFARLWENPDNKKTSPPVSGIRLDDIQIRLKHYLPDEFELDFFGNNNCIVTLKRAVTSDSDGDTYFHGLSLELNISALQQYSDEFFQKWGKPTRIENALKIWDSNPTDVKKIMDDIRNHNNIAFQTDFVFSKKWLQIYIMAEDSIYYQNINSHELFSSFLDLLINSISHFNKPENIVIKSFQEILDYIFRQHIIHPLKNLKTKSDRCFYLSAFRGYYTNDPNSYASVSFRNFLMQQKEIQKKEKRLIEFYEKNSKFFKDKDNLPSENEISKKDLTLEQFVEREQNRFLSPQYEISKKDLFSREFIKKWISTLGIGIDIDTNSDTPSIKINDEFTRRIEEFGFGIQQFLPILSGIATDPDRVFFIEEPESHLHPAFQSKLADFFVEALEFQPKTGIVNDEKTQFIIETHSEYFIRKLQYLVAKGAISPDDIAIYYIDNKDGSSTIKEMELRKDGILKNDFGSGFFDESVRLTMQLLTLQSKN